MADTTYTTGVTAITADTMNDLNRLHYTILSDPADAAAVRTALSVVPLGVTAGTAVQVDQAVTATTRSATTTLGTSLNHTLSDTSTTITAFNGVAGVTYQCRTLGAGSITHHATNLIITQGSADLTTANGMTFDVEMITSTTCRIKNIMKANGTAVIGGVLASVNFNGTGVVSIRDSLNVSSITDNGTGDYTINFTTNLPDTNYIVNISIGNTVAGNYTGGVLSSAVAVGSVRIFTTDGGGTPTDYPYVFVTIGAQ